MPPLFASMLVHMPWFSRGFRLFALAPLIGTIGLLLRRNLERLLFIGVLALDIVYQLAGIGVQW